MMHLCGYNLSEYLALIISIFCTKRNINMNAG